MLRHFLSRRFVSPAVRKVAEHTTPFVPGISGKVCKAGKCREHSALSLVRMRRSYRISSNV
jgi:hypothetical protein